MSPHSSIHLRPATFAEEEFLERLYFDCHIEEFLPMGLSGPELNALLRMQFRAQRAGYAKDFADATDRIVVDEDGEQPIGRLLVANRRDALHLVDIALIPSARGRGVGTQLIGDLQEEARRKNLPVRLQVRPGNPAYQLYSRLGFRLIGGGMNLDLEFPPGAGEPRESLAVRAEDAAPDPDPMQQWSPFQGRSFRVVEVAPDAFPPLLLARLERIGFAASITYSLIFHGPPDRLLPQATYSLRLCNEGSHVLVEEEDRVVFLVPIGPKENVMQYEAIFS